MMLPPPACKVYTPPRLAEAMVHALEPAPLDLWLDPCMGPGAFIASLREKGVHKVRIVGIDIEPLRGMQDEGATTIRGVDFFTWCASTKRRFTKIIANPPYVAIRKLHPHLQKSLLSYAPETDRSFALRSNYWCAFLSASLRVLDQNGNLAFVLPAAWEYALYAADVRQAIYQNFQSVEVHRCLEPLFPDVREGCVVLLAKGYGKTPARAVRADHNTALALIAALTQGGCQVQPLSQPLPRPLEGAFIPFSDLYNINIGCVTGDVNYFLLTESDRIDHKLPLEAVRPIVSKARHLSAARITKAEWQRLHGRDERVWLFHPDAKTLHLPAVREYIRYGKGICNLEGYKLKHRDPWYIVPDIKTGVGFLSGMTKLGPWISFRSMRGLSATNTLYVLTPRTVMCAEERSAWALSLLSTPSRRQFHELARRYPDGLAKLEPHDLYSLRLPPPVRTHDAIGHYQRAIQFLVSDRVAQAVEIADSYIGGAATPSQPGRTCPRLAAKQHARGACPTC
jgi:adenine-specific DNA-methyltransferase